MLYVRKRGFGLVDLRKTEQDRRVTPPLFPFSAHLSVVEQHRSRLRFFAADKLQNGVAFVVLAIASLAFVSNDFLLLGGTRWLYPIVATRMVSALFALLTGILLWRARRPVQHDHVLIFGLFSTALCLNIINLSRAIGGHHIGALYTVSVLSVTYYFVLRGPLWPRVTVAVMGLLGLLTILWNPRIGMVPSTRNAASIALLSINLLGVFFAKSFEWQRHHQHRAERRERRARNELAAKLRELAAEKERAESMSRTRTAFLAAMSHEFRTPMNAIMGLSEVLLDSPLGAADRQHVQIIADSARGLLSLLTDILDFTRIDSQRLVLSPVDFDLRRLTASVLDMLRQCAQRNGIDLRLDLPDDLPTHVRGDDARLRQVLVNLLSNAIKFTEQGSVRLQVQGRPAPEAACDFTFLIHDTGIGMRPDVIARLFRPFEQADAGIARRYGGTGLGLAICKQIVAAMGGDLQVQSQPGAGSVFFFTVRLPCSFAPIAAAPVPSLPSPASLPAGEPPHRPPLAILVVDDQPINRDVVRVKLGRLGYQADQASDGPDAIRAVAQRAYDVIFMDLQMPGMSGLEAARQILSRRDPRPPHIIALTASVLDEDRSACVQAGMFDYITKPIETPHLVSVLSRVAAGLSRPGATDVPPPASAIPMPG